MLITRLVDDHVLAVAHDRDRGAGAGSPNGRPDDQPDPLVLEDRAPVGHAARLGERLCKRGREIVLGGVDGDEFGACRSRQSTWP